MLTVTTDFKLIIYLLTSEKLVEEKPGMDASEVDELEPNLSNASLTSKILLLSKTLSLLTWTLKVKSFPQRALIMAG